MFQFQILCTNYKLNVSSKNFTFFRQILRVTWSTRVEVGGWGYTKTPGVFFTMADFAGVSGNRLKHKLRDVESELHVASEALGCRWWLDG